MAEEFNEASEQTIKSLIDLARQGNLTAQDLQKVSASSAKFDKIMSEAGKATANATSGMWGFSKNVASGGTQLNTMSSAVTAAGSVIKGFAESVPLVGNALGALTQAAVDTANLAIERLQVSFSAFQELSKQGLIGAKGISGLREQMIKSQIPMESFQKILAYNTEALSYFAGSATEGGDTLAKVMQQMQTGQGMQLRRLGFSIEEIGETVVDFQKTYRQIGSLQTMSNQQLAQATSRYGQELDLIAKITGQNRREAQKNREQLLADTRFRAWMHQSQSQDEKERKIAMGDFIKSIGKMAPTMSEGLKDMFASGGVPTSEAGKKLVVQGMGPAIMEIRKQMLSGNMDVATARAELFKAALENRDRFKDLSALLGDFGAGIPYQEMAELGEAVGMTPKDINKLVDAQKKQVKGSDGLTDSLTSTVMHLQRIQTRLDAFATSATGAASMVSKMTGYFEKLIDWMNNDMPSQLGKYADKAKEVGSQIIEFMSELRKLLPDIIESFTKIKRIINVFSEEGVMGGIRQIGAEGFSSVMESVPGSVIKQAFSTQSNPPGVDDEMMDYLQERGWSRERINKMTAQELSIMKKQFSDFRMLGGTLESSMFGKTQANYTGSFFGGDFGSSVSPGNIQEAGAKYSAYQAKKAELEAMYKQMSTDKEITSTEAASMRPLIDELRAVQKEIMKLGVLQAEMARESREQSRYLKIGATN